MKSGNAHINLPKISLCKNVGTKGVGPCGCTSECDLRGSLMECTCNLTRLRGRRMVSKASLGNPVSPCLKRARCGGSHL